MGWIVTSKALKGTQLCVVGKPKQSRINSVYNIKCCIVLESIAK
jgi:hypothetical protein